MFFRKYKEPLITISLVMVLGLLGAWFEFSERQHTLDMIDKVQTQVMQRAISVEVAQRFLSEHISKNYEYEKPALSTLTTVVMVAARSGVGKQEEAAVRYVLFSEGEAAVLLRPQTVKYLQRLKDMGKLKPASALLLGAYLQQNGAPVSVVKPYYETSWLAKNNAAATYLGKLYLDNNDIPNYYLWCARGHCLSLSERFRSLDASLKERIDKVMPDIAILEVAYTISAPAK